MDDILRRKEFLSARPKQYKVLRVCGYFSSKYLTSDEDCFEQFLKTLNTDDYTVVAASSFLFARLAFKQTNKRKTTTKSITVVDTFYWSINKMYCVIIFVHQT